MYVVIGAYFGTVVSMPLSAAIADSLGWGWVFYIFGEYVMKLLIVWNFPSLVKFHHWKCPLLL